MKLLKYFPILLGLAAASCSDEVGPKISANKVPAEISLPAVGSAYVLSQDKIDEVVDTVKWSAADFGFQAAVTYTVQLAKSGTNFEGKVAPVVEVNELNAAITVKDLNNAALSLGLAFDKEHDVEIRIKASISDAVESVVGAPIALKVTPFEMIINYPKIYVPGSFSGWGDAFNEATLTVAYSLDDDKIYENYFFFNAPNVEFKFRTLPSWDSGDEYACDKNNLGTLTKGGDNIPANNKTAGVYNLKVNLNTMTYSLTRTDWGLIGSAIGGWGDDDDIMMDWDAEQRALVVTTNMVEGEFKFRANHGWGINYGVEADAMAGILTFNKDNIKVDKAGKYKVTFFIMEPIKRYTIEKL